MSERPDDDRPVDEPAVDVDQPEERAASDPRVAAAVDRLHSLAERPPAEHVQVYEEVHAVLQESLADAQGDPGDPGDQAPGGAAR